MAVQWQFKMMTSGCAKSLCKNESLNIISVEANHSSPEKDVWSLDDGKQKGKRASAVLPAVARKDSVRRGVGLEGCAGVNLSHCNI